MTRKQKYILIILGMLDFVVIGALAAIVLHSSPSTPEAPPTDVRVQISPCAQAMLDVCNTLPEPFNDAATVAWDATQLYVTLQAVYPTTPPPESAQLVWMVLDEIALILQSGCTTPETVTIALTAHGDAGSVQYLAQFAGQDIAAWMAGILPEEDLAAQSHFRQTTSSTDVTNRTD